MSHAFKYTFFGVAGFLAALGIWGARLQWPAPTEASLAPALVPASTAAAAPATKLVPDFTALAEEMSPTVVNIYTASGPGEMDREMQEYFNFRGLPFGLPQMKREALGSGFVVNADQGFIVTNAHVVRMAGRNADEIMVKFIGEENGKGHPAKVVGADEVSDVALLKLVEKRDGLKAARLGDSVQSKVGEWVLAIGNPYGHTHTVTQGIVSALGRNLDGARSEFMQTSAGINPGNSGGPLINMKGEVIGINTAVDPRAQSIGFAIPINTAKNVIAQLEETGRVRRAWLGVAIEDLNDETAGMMRLKNREGVLIRDVVAEAPAAKAGIERFDIIRKIEGKEIHNTRELYRSMEQLNAGTTAEVELWRGGNSRTVKVQLGEQPSRG